MTIYSGYMYTLNIVFVTNVCMLCSSLVATKFQGNDCYKTVCIISKKLLPLQWCVFWCVFSAGFCKNSKQLIEKMLVYDSLDCLLGIYYLIHIKFNLLRMIHGSNWNYGNLLYILVCDGGVRRHSYMINFKSSDIMSFRHECF